MKILFRKPIGLVVLWAALAALAPGEVVETWYNAEGVVVKKVKRTRTGPEAQTSADWEPQWVAREKRRQQGSRTVRYASPSRRGYGYRPYWGSGYSYFSPTRFCAGSRGRSPGFTGSYRGGSRGPRWAVSYRSPGLSIRYHR